MTSQSKIGEDHEALLMEKTDQTAVLFIRFMPTTTKADLVQRLAEKDRGAQRIDIFRHAS